MPRTEKELKELAIDAGSALQIIQDEYGRNNTVDAQVRFPRGFIRTAKQLEKSIPKLGTKTQRRNVCYALMTTDVFRWLAIRTDISGTALSMIIKETICIYGFACEWMTKEATRGKGSKKPFSDRTQRLVDDNIISRKQKTDLDWVWDIRCREHIHKPDKLEYKQYTRANQKRAVRAYSALCEALIKHGNTK